MLNRSQCSVELPELYTGEGADIYKRSSPALCNGVSCTHIADSPAQGNLLPGEHVIRVDNRRYLQIRWGREVE